MIHFLTVIGARPQIIKAAALSRSIRNSFKDKIRETIVHTGQHYDHNMSQVFIDELEIPEPDYNLKAGSGLHGEQTAKMISGIESVLLKEKPDYIILFGDTNSTLAGAVAASKLHIPVIHIEAGLRSFNKKMPEEINRILCDHVSTILCCPTKTALLNLFKEGFKESPTPPWSPDNPLTVMTGDLMLDNSIYFGNSAELKSNITEQLNLQPEGFILATLHRPHNTDNPERLNPIFKSFAEIAETHKIPIIIPLHPRTAKYLNSGLHPDVLSMITDNNNIRIIPPVSFLDMIKLEKNCRIVITDSGGVQKEAFFYKKPGIILRAETEWVEIVECGAGVIADADENTITSSVNKYMTKPPANFPDYFGNGKAAENICSLIYNMHY